MEKLELNKTIYKATNAYDSLDEEFMEFVPKKYTIDDLFEAYNYLFYDIRKEGKKHSHFNIVQESIRHAGYPINPKDYYMQSGRRRELNSKTALQLIKRRAGKRNVPDEDFVVLVGGDCIAGILAGPPVDSVEDLNIDIMELNRFDERQFETQETY